MPDPGPTSSSRAAMPPPMAKRRPRSRALPMTGSQPSARSPGRDKGAISARSLTQGSGFAGVGACSVCCPTARTSAALPSPRSATTRSSSLTPPPAASAAPASEPAASLPPIVTQTLTEAISAAAAGRGPDGGDRCRHSARHRSARSPRHRRAASRRRARHRQCVLAGGLRCRPRRARALVTAQSDLTDTLVATTPGGRPEPPAPACQPDRERARSPSLASAATAGPRWRRIPMWTCCS